MKNEHDAGSDITEDPPMDPSKYVQDTTFTCTSCDTKCATFKEFKKHLYEAHILKKDGELRFFCLTCGKSFYSSFDKLEHRRFLIHRILDHGYAVHNQKYYAAQPSLDIPDKFPFYGTFLESGARSIEDMNIPEFMDASVDTSGDGFEDIDFNEPMTPKVSNVSAAEGKVKQDQELVVEMKMEKMCFLCHDERLFMPDAATLETHIQESHCVSINDDDSLLPCSMCEWMCSQSQNPEGGISWMVEQMTEHISAVHMPEEGEEEPTTKVNDPNTAIGLMSLLPEVMQQSQSSTMSSVDTDPNHMTITLSQSTDNTEKGAEDRFERDNSTPYCFLCVEDQRPTFEYMGELHTHVRDVHLLKEAKYLSKICNGQLQCAECDKSFPQTHTLTKQGLSPLLSLVVHMKYEHNFKRPGFLNMQDSADLKAELRTKPKSAVVVENKNTQPYCFLCRDEETPTFDSISELHDHLRDVHLETDDDEGGDDNNKGTRVVSRLQCPKCPKTFLQTLILTKHGMSPLLFLVDHMVSQHNVPRPGFVKVFKCVKCSFSSILHDKFLMHVRRRHPSQAIASGGRVMGGRLGAKLPSSVMCDTCGTILQTNILPQKPCKDM